MPKAFSLASWNVEHFKDDPQRIKRVVQFLKDQNPDIFALYEVEGKEVYSQFMAQMASFQFHITEGPQVQEILVGAKKGFSAFFTQKVEFKSGISLLRPGALLSVHLDGEDYTILFLHTKSSSKPIGLGIRDDMFERAFKFKKYLDKTGQGKAHFMFLGDLNTMGMTYPFKKGIDPTTELKKLDRQAKKVKMRRLTKNKPYTWWNGPSGKYAPAEIDHVIASEELKFSSFGASDIDVRGWPAMKTDTEKGAWISTYSDHGLLYLVVEKV
jgi:exonuclease III